MIRLFSLASLTVMLLATPLGCREDHPIPPPEQGTVTHVEFNKTTNRDTITVTYDDGKTATARVSPGQCPAQSKYPHCVGEG